MVLAAQENQQVIIELAASCCQKQSVYLASSYKPLQLTKQQARVQTGCFKKHILSTTLNSSCSILHLAWIPKLFSPSSGSSSDFITLKKKYGLPPVRGCPASEALRGSSRLLSLSLPSNPKKTLPELLFLCCNRLPE